MAHWIIEDKGYGGVVYKCSNCGESWNDYYDTFLKDYCPNCKEDIDEDANQYIEESKNYKIKIQLPCEIGTRIRDKEKDFEMRVIGYQITGNGNPLFPSHKVYAETQECLIAIYNGAFPDNIEVIGF